MSSKNKKKSELSIFEPMLFLEVRILIWDNGKLEYEKHSKYKIRNCDAGCTHTWPIDEWESEFWMIWIRDINDTPHLIHELYHLVQAVRHCYDLCEETWAYLIWYLTTEIYNSEFFI